MCAHVHVCICVFENFRLQIYCRHASLPVYLFFHIYLNLLKEKNSINISLSFVSQSLQYVYLIERINKYVYPNIVKVSKVAMERRRNFTKNFIVECKERLTHFIDYLFACPSVWGETIMNLHKILKQESHDGPGSPT